jgi:DNA adenine methylase
MAELKPFLKWAGGKRQLISTIKTYYPFDKGYTRYVEPFVGGGAVLFDILENQHIEEIYISDINDSLINTYLIIRDECDKLIKELKKLDREYKMNDIVNRKQNFLNRRDDFNKLTNILSRDKYSRIRKAAYFIFLNKTCFNGLYRVNGDGKFNVSFGKYTNPIICDEENLKSISKKLQNIKISCCPYSDMLSKIDEHTFVFLDPPYRPLSKTSSFNSYAKDTFDDLSQIELAEFINKIDKIGAKFILCNSDPHNADPTDNFFDDLYKDYTIRRISATRMINSKASARGAINELLITNI